jgi:hypothetical protein
MVQVMARYATTHPVIAAAPVKFTPTMEKPSGIVCPTAEESEAHPETI